MLATLIPTSSPSYEARLVARAHERIQADGDQADQAAGEQDQVRVGAARIFSRRVARGPRRVHRPQRPPGPAEQRRGRGVPSGERDQPPRSDHADDDRGEPAARGARGQSPRRRDPDRDVSPGARAPRPDRPAPPPLRRGRHDTVIPARTLPQTCPRGARTCAAPAAAARRSDATWLAVLAAAAGARASARTISASSPPIGATATGSAGAAAAARAARRRSPCAPAVSPGPSVSRSWPARFSAN